MTTQPVSPGETLDAVIRRIHDQYGGNLHAALRDCLQRGEAPFASHALYTRPGVLDDSNTEERCIGIEAGLAWGEVADATVIYVDLGVTAGMQIGMRHAMRAGRTIEERSLPGWSTARAADSRAT